MKVLLIFPQYTHSNEYDSRAPSMSLFYIASALEKAGHEVEIFDASLGPIEKTGTVHRYGVSENEMKEKLRKSSFDLVGITCSYAARWRFVEKIADQVKELRKNVPVAIGGLFPTYSSEYCLNTCRSVDFVMLGEAELTFTHVVDNISGGMNVNDACRNVDGVVWRQEDKIIQNPKKAYNDALDELPFPAWHLVDLNEYFQYQKNIFELKTPNLPILSSRSCPNRCRFCNMYITHGSKWRSRSAENVLDEIEYLIGKYNIHNFYFIDDNFSINLKRAKAVCQGMIDRNLNIKYNFHNGLSIKSMDFELVQLMKKSGCTSVCLAIESGSERIRNEVYAKKLGSEKIYEVVKWFNKVGIPTIGYFLVGAPGETREDLKMSEEMMRKLPLTLVTVGIFTPYPGTELYDESKEKGWLVELPPEDEKRVELFVSMLKTPDFTPEDVAKWQKELYMCFIKYHWLTLLKEVFRPEGVLNKDMMGKFLGFLKFRKQKIK